MSTTPKTDVDCVHCNALANHRHTPNCVAVVGLSNDDQHMMRDDSFTQIIEEFDRKYFGRSKNFADRGEV